VLAERDLLRAGFAQRLQHQLAVGIVDAGPKLVAVPGSCRGADAVAFDALRRARGSFPGSEGGGQGLRGHGITAEWGFLRILARRSSIPCGTKPQACDSAGLLPA